MRAAEVGPFRGPISNPWSILYPKKLVQNQMLKLLLFSLIISGHLAGYRKSMEGEVSCHEITAVRKIPFHAGDKVDDDAYNKLSTKSWAAVPCLIGQIMNTRRTPDPRSAPLYGDVRVGDVSFWVIKDITGLPYDQMFPHELVARFPDEGVYAYFDWVRKDGNRKKLRDKVMEWYKSHVPQNERR